MTSETSNHATNPPLAHLRVVDLTTDLGTLAVRLLSGFGANVTRVETPGGDPLRQKPPLAPGKDGQPVSLYWLHMMDGRETVTLDLEADAGREAFLALLDESDIVVESQPWGRLAAVGLDYAELHDRFPHLIWTSITPFGREGPHADWQGTDLIGMAAGGLMSLCGDPGLPPLRVSVEQGYAQAGAVAAAGTLAALHARNLSCMGQLVDVSMQEAVANCLGNARLFYEFDGIVSKRAGGARAYGEHGARLVYPCADGYVAISRSPDTMLPLHRWIRESGMDPGWDAEEWATLPQSGPGTPGPEKTKELEDSLVAFFKTKGKMALYEEGQGLGIMICPASTPADLLINEQLRDRGYFVERNYEELGRTVKVPGAPAIFSRTPWRSGPVSQAEAKREQPPTAAQPGEKDSRKVLAGVRVADFSWVGVGPICTQLLATMGAEVIRVESSARLDVFRSGGPKRGNHPDSSAYFGNCNRDKLGITLNLGKKGAREVALRLAAESDILVESFRPGFMRSVGLSYEDIRAVNPGIIMMSASMEGATGPHTSFKGFGLTLQATVGFTHFTGWPGRAPVGTGTAYTDWFATNIAAASVLSALEHRRRTGEGQYVDLSQLEACAWALDAEVLRYTATGELREPLGNRHESMAPHGVFPAEGNDQWIAIAVRDDRDWQALVAAMGEALPLELGQLGFEGRKEQEDAIEGALAAWTASLEKHALATSLQAEGVPAHAVNDMRDVAEDPQLEARGHFWKVTHPEIGEAGWDAPAFRLSETPLYPRNPAPKLGEHNNFVYREVLGCSDEEIAEMAIAGLLD